MSMKYLICLFSSGCIAVGGIVSYYQHWNFFSCYSLSTWGTTLICKFILQKSCIWGWIPFKRNHQSSICPCSLLICIKKNSLEKMSDLGFDAGCLLCVLPHLQAQIRLGPGRDKIYQTLLVFSKGKRSQEDELSEVRLCGALAEELGQVHGRGRWTITIIIITRLFVLIIISLSSSC